MHTKLPVEKNKRVERLTHSKQLQLDNISNGGIPKGCKHVLNDQRVRDCYNCRNDHFPVSTFNGGMSKWKNRM